jgi:hypothetical protein
MKLIFRQPIVAMVLAISFEDFIPSFNWETP